MPDLFDIIKRWWKYMISFVIITIVLVGIIVFLKPKLYLSTATAIPASSYATDKGKVFNENIQALYSAFGDADDLDLILGTSELDTIYIAVSADNNLKEHYQISGEGPEAIRKAADCLRKKSRVVKSGYGELKVKVWDGNNNIAANLANDLLDKLAEMHRNLRSQSNESTLQSLLDGRNKILAGKDSTGAQSLSQVFEYDKLINEYRIMVDSKPSVLVTVEKARPALYPSKPRKKQIIAASAVLAFIFSLLVALVLERRKNEVS